MHIRVAHSWFLCICRSHSIGKVEGPWRVLCQQKSPSRVQDKYQGVAGRKRMIFHPPFYFIACSLPDTTQLSCCSRHSNCIYLSKHIWPQPKELQQSLQNIFINFLFEGNSSFQLMLIFFSHSDSFRILVLVDAWGNCHQCWLCSTSINFTYKVTFQITITWTK